MAKFTVGKGAEEYVKKLEGLEKETQHIIGKAVYDGAKIVTDAIHAGISAIPVHIDSKVGSDSDPVSGLTAAQRQGLLDGLGIAKMQNRSGYLHVKVGVDGYNRTKTKKYPNGQPNALIMRSIESGTSFRAKHPVVAPAVARTRKSAEKAMADRIDSEVNKKMKG